MEYNYIYDNISEEEFQLRIKKYYSDMDNLYKIMPSLTHEEYRKQYKAVSEVIHKLGQYIVFPNTAKIELQEFEIFGIHWYDYYFDESLKN